MKPLAKDIIDALKVIGIEDYLVDMGNAPILVEKTSTSLIRRIFAGDDIEDEPVEILSFLIPSDDEDNVLNYIVAKGNLTVPGRGSVYSERVEVPKCNEHCLVNEVKNIPDVPHHEMLTNITGICCIVQRGQGEKVARVVLDAGLGTPNLTFGTGTGVRDKMGLLRITIPAEKDVIWVATSGHDAEMAMDAMIKAGQLDLPGKGFIYLFPLGRGVLNLKVTSGVQRAAASIEQIVASIDQMQNGSEWRRSSEVKDQLNKRTYLQDLIDMTLVCDEGGSSELVAAAMNQGAAGATISKLKYASPDDSAGSSLSKSREACSMIVSSQQSESIMDVLEQSKAFSDKHHGQVLIRKVNKAFTYLGGK